MPDQTDHQPTQDEVEHTIETENHVDEASFESFPASDPPAWTGDHAGRAQPQDEDPEG